ncbi:hypothetical protein RHSIM_Rhsim08G0139500 [Rhododendron simsii]|uniref:EF-hand domain-containing protein n=1 Tax=Rhododendron simsii TaxID=118357 RepID=A0A834GJT0_RHOSS|nr:hypothetical protein RHSIM_Rhsim08G0139500 [Rhododendron simsii]
MSTFLEIHQRDQLRAIFTRFDMDSNGSLTLLELATFLHSLSVKTSSGDQVHTLPTTIYANANCKEQLLGVFLSFDRDGNGYITLEELAGSMAKMGQPLTYRELTEMVREGDIDGDGVISFNKFASIMARSVCEMFEFPVS